MSTWERDWERLVGWKRWLVVAGAVHASFTDLALLADQTSLLHDATAHLAIVSHMSPIKSAIALFTQRNVPPQSTK